MCLIKKHPHTHSVRKDALKRREGGGWLAIASVPLRIAALLSCHWHRPLTHDLDAVARHCNDLARKRRGTGALEAVAHHVGGVLDNDRCDVRHRAQHLGNRAQLLAAVARDAERKHVCFERPRGLGDALRHWRASFHTPHVYTARHAMRRHERPVLVRRRRQLLTWLAARDKDDVDLVGRAAQQLRYVQERKCGRVRPVARKHNLGAAVNRAAG
mmetsp:Transcript_26172/g.77630  ORF Transcript_26172/g.77630 Transcript_26172/m.77630 type:complete len:214 (-) Transcript_26172:678-1319(-)